MEIWRYIEGYEGLYQVSNEGNVKNKHEKSISKRYCKGYLRVHLWKNGKGKHHLIHRLVAEAFIPNEDNKPCIDHINGKRDDNRVENLRWCTQKENNNFELAKIHQSQAQKGRIFTEKHKKNLSESLKHSERFQKTIHSEEYSIKLSELRKGKMLNRKDLSVQVDQIDPKTGEVLASYPSAKQAARDLGVGQSNISRCCNGGYYWKNKWVNISEAYGFIWKKVQLR